MNRPSPDPIRPDQVYIPNRYGYHSRHSHRRVIAVLQQRVIYSAGGDKNYSCSYRWFRRWAVQAETFSPVAQHRP